MISASLFICTSILFCKTSSHSSYKAAVLEYHPVISDTPKSTILMNLNEYRYFAAKAQVQGVDIMVFPEYGLTTLCNNSRKYAIEISDSDVITRLQDMAAEYGMYLVVNLLEKFRESCCSTPKFYNTNLVFDRSGNIIAQYRKINLFKENDLTPGSLFQNMTFVSDFGITFGVFSSHDILYEHPSRSILQNKNVSSIVFPTAWFSSLPFYTALSFQYGYAISTRVNLLASSYNHPFNYISGSGIYLGASGNLKNYLTDTPSTKLIVYDVPKWKDEKNICSSSLVKFHSSYSRIESKFWPSRDFEISVYKFKTVDHRQNFSTQICYNKFCCNFEIIVDVEKTSSTDNFKLAAFDGLVYFDQQKSRIRVCSLLVCENDSEDSCGKRTLIRTKFSKIRISKTLEDNDMSYIPLTLNYNLQPLLKSSFCNYKNNTNLSKIELTVTEPEEILVFGIFGQKNSASTYQKCYWLLLLFIYNW